MVSIQLDLFAFIPFAFILWLTWLGLQPVFRVLFLFSDFHYPFYSVFHHHPLSSCLSYHPFANPASPHVHATHARSPHDIPLLIPSCIFTPRFMPYSPSPFLSFYTTIIPTNVPSCMSTRSHHYARLALRAMSLSPSTQPILFTKPQPPFHLNHRHQLPPTKLRLSLTTMAAGATLFIIHFLTSSNPQDMTPFPNPSYIADVCEDLSVFPPPQFPFDHSFSLHSLSLRSVCTCICPEACPESPFAPSLSTCKIKPIKLPLLSRSP